MQTYKMNPNKKVAMWVKNGTMQIAKNELDVYQNLMASVDVSKDTLNRVLPTHENAPDYANDYNSILPNIDPILEEDPNAGFKLHEDLLSNAFVYGCYDSRINNVISQEFYLNKGECSDVEFEVINELMTAFQNYGIIKQLLKGRFISPQAIAMPWEKQDNWWLPIASMIYKTPPDRVRYNKDNQLVILTNKERENGEIVHPHNYLVAAEDADYLNPYGTSVLSKIYWMVFIMKKAFGYWSTLAEDHTIPFLDASYDVQSIKKALGTERVNLEETSKQIMATLSLMRQNRILAHGDFLNVNLKESASSSAADVYDKLILTCKKAISVLLTGHESSSMATPGELGGQEKALSIREEIRGADIRFVTRYMNILIDRIWFWNFDAKKPKPVFKVKQESDIDKLTKKAQLFVIVETQLNRDIDNDYLAGELEIPPEMLMKKKNTPIQKNESAPKYEAKHPAAEYKTMNFLDNKQNTIDFPKHTQAEVDQEDYEKLIDEFKIWLNDPDTNNTLMNDLTKPLFDYVDDKETLDQMGEEYYKLFSKIDDKPFEERIAMADFLSYLVGYVYSEAAEGKLTEEDNANLSFDKFINKEDVNITVADIQFAMALSPKDAVEYFKKKGIKISFDWKAAVKAVEEHAFTVSGVLKLDLLKDFKDLIVEAIEQGKSRAQFRKDLKEMLAKKGWLGKRDETKPGTSSKLESPWRMDLIYHNNTRDALHNAKWDQMQTTIDFIPYIKSLARMNGLHPDSTEQCKKLHNKVFKKDDKFYLKFLRCLRHHRCYSIEVSMTESQLTASGLSVSKGTDFAKYKNAAGFVHDGPWKPDMSKYPKELIDEYEG